MELSRDNIALIIANNVTPSEATIEAARGVASVEGINSAADEIWKMVADAIHEAECRVIDAEFKAQESAREYHRNTES